MNNPSDWIGLQLTISSEGKAIPARVVDHIEGHYIIHDSSGKTHLINDAMFKNILARAIIIGGTNG